MAHRPVSEEVVHSWGVPHLGVLRDLPVHALPEGAFYDALNAVLRAGVVRPRDGLVLHSTTDLLARGMGAYVVPAATLVATTAKVWKLVGATWTDITGVTALTGTADDIVRFAQLEVADLVQTLIVNGVNVPQRWDGVAATAVDVAGAPSVWTDIATASDRIVGIKPPYDVQWGNPYNVGTWPALNIRILSDTPDKVVAIRPLGTQAVIVYKEESLWGGFPTGGTDAQAFRFDPRLHIDGPAGPSAVTQGDGEQYYMTATGRIASFDGTTHEWIADGVWPIVRADLDVSKAGRIIGMQVPFTDEVVFAYPRVGDAGELKGCVICIPPRPEHGIEEWAAFPCRLVVAMSAAVARRAPTWDVLAFTSATPFRSYTVTADSGDAGTAFTGFWQTGLKPNPGADVFRMESIETWAERGAGFGTLTVKPVSSYILDAPGGTLGAGQTIDLTATTAVKESKGADVAGRFFGLRYEFSSASKPRWMGARVAGRRLE